VKLANPTVVDERELVSVDHLPTFLMIPVEKGLESKAFINTASLLTLPQG
jgi:hypothetical protein